MRNALIFWAALGSSMPALVARGEDHWAFQPIRRSIVPESAAADPVRWFIDRRLEEAGLPAAPPAARRDWIRRLHYNFIGLPPAFSEMEKLCASKEDDPALAKWLVENLLTSPRYGERWARHWLDVARYSDTKGYAYSDEESNFPHAWLYRDWVIGAFNDDMPYDQFVQRQLAGDLLLERGLCDRRDLAAMGFLTLGRRFLGVEPEIIDDRIDVATRGLLGLTVSCARCHDHKFDPVPTADYYALYGMFKSSREELIPRDPEAVHAHAELEKKKAALAAEFEKQAAELEKRFLDRAAEYMLAALDISKVPPPDFSEILQKDDLNPAQIRRWYEYLSQEARRDDPVFAPWLALSEGRAEAASDANPLVREALSGPVKDVAVAARCYAELFKRAGGKDGENDAPEWRQLREVVAGPGSPIRVPREYVHDVEWLFDTDTNKSLKKKLAELDREIVKLGEKAPHALVLVDRAVPQNVHIFKRGQYPEQGAEVNRGSIAVLHAGHRPGYRNGSGRLEFAREITSAKNPLTARVIVNRLWRVHFGQGLVRTESDFGLRSDPPSHPALLDYLAAELVDSGWSIKHVQRLIATSAVNRRRAGPPPASDPENRLLSVYPRRRLDFEAMRDTMLAATGELDLRMGGLPGELFGAGASTRRSIYGRIDRQFLPSTLRVFDFANPELHTPRRYRTNVPQQALFLMNAPFTVTRARALAARLKKELPDPAAEPRVRRLFQHVYGREPSGEEMAGSLRFVEARPRPVEKTAADPATKTWSYGYGRFDETRGRIADFHVLPHFDGKAWGGGSSWPDGALGWLRLTDVGGHAGHDANHAAVRRWTSPVAGSIDLSGTIAQIEKCGDGLRAWVSSSRQGVLASWRIEFGKDQPAELAAVEVEAGELLDFVIDCGEANNFQCDGFRWAPRLQRSSGAEGWDATRNFGGVVTQAEELDSWERFAQALLISNEAMFLD